MAALVRADLRRIVRKKGFWILHIFLFLCQVIDTLRVIEENNEAVISAAQANFGGFYLLLTSVFVYLSVFGDDVKSNVPPSVIGLGMTKSRFLRTKILDCALLMGIYYAVIMGVRFFFFTNIDIHISGRQLQLLMLYGALTVLRGLCCIAASILLQQLLGSSAAGILTLVVTTILLGNALRMIQTIYHIGVYDYLPDGLLERTMDAVSAGNLPLELVPFIAVYFCGIIWAACRVFKRKELEL